MSAIAHLAAPPDYAGPRRSLVLAGGGMRVAYQAGAVRALEEAGLCFHHADGTSGGTINLAMLLSGLTPTEMCERWYSLDPKNFMSLMPLEDYLRLGDTSALASADGIRERVFPHLGIDLDAINHVVGMEGTFNLCNFSRKLLVTVPNAELSVDMLVAGISLPVLMPAIARDGEFFTDGVWIKDANLMGAVERGAEEIWVVWCIANAPTYHNGLLRQYVHMIEMAANGALFAELAQISAINERIRRGEAVGGRNRPIVVHLIKPRTPLPLDPDYFLGRISGAALIELGHKDATDYLLSRNPEGLPLTPDITRVPDEPSRPSLAKWPELAPSPRSVSTVSALLFFYGYVLTLIVAGLWGVVGARIDQKLLFDLDPATLKPAVSASLISQYRFMRAIEFGFGLFSIIFKREIFTARKFNQVFLGAMALGVLARIVSLFLDGAPYPVFDFFLVFELVGVILIYACSRGTLTT